MAATSAPAVRRLSARRVAGSRVPAAASARRSSAVRSRSLKVDAKAVAEPDQMSIRTYVLADLDADERVEILKRPRVDFTNILGTVAPIVDAVATRGDEAVLEYTSKFDKVDLDKCVVRVADLPDPKLDDDVKAAFDMAYDNILQVPAFGKKELADVDVETMPGVRCRRVSRPIGAVDLPGGTAVLPSTALHARPSPPRSRVRDGGAATPPWRMAPSCPRCCTSPRRRA